MKSLTEFAVFTLQKGLQAHTELTTQGKTADEVSSALGETFKLEGDKLKHFVNSLEVAKQATSGRLKRVLVVSFNEGEKVPDVAVKVEESYYLPEFHREAPTTPAPAQNANNKRGGGRNARGGNNRPPRKNKPADPAATAELKKFASSDGRADNKAVGDDAN